MHWHKLGITLYQQNKKAAVMKNTEYTYTVLDSIVASEESLTALLEMIEDMDLEITGVKQSW